MRDPKQQQLLDRVASEYPVILGKLTVIDVKGYWFVMASQGRWQRRIPVVMYNPANQDYLPIRENLQRLEILGPAH